MPTTWKHRYTIMVLMFLTYLLCYMDRMIMAAALPFIADDLHLDSVQMGYVLSAFFFSYAIFQIPGGLLADKFGPRVILTIGIVWWSIFTGLTGVATGLLSMLLIRVAFGVGEGIFPPAAFKTIATWFPKREIGRANGIMLTTNSLGPALAPLFVSAVVLIWGWRMVFISMAVPGFVIAYLLWMYVRRKPSESPRMTAAELAEYDEPQTASASVAKESVGIGDLFQMPMIWLCFCTLFFFNIAQWGIMSWLPTYMLKARGFSIAQMGIAASLPFLMGTLGYYVSGYLSDKFFKDSRQNLVIVGALIGAVFLYLTAIVPTGIQAVVCQMVSFFFITIASGAIFTLPVATLPSQVVGSAMGVVNTAGQAAGFLSPLIVGYILKANNESFDWVFYTFVICLLISSAFAACIRAKKEPSVAAAAKA